MERGEREKWERRGGREGGAVKGCGWWRVCVCVYPDLQISCLGISQPLPLASQNHTCAICMTIHHPLASTK